MIFVLSLLHSLLTGEAVSEGVSRVAAGAVAGDAVRAHAAHRARGARVCRHAGIDTTAGPADLAVPALAVRATPRLGSRSYAETTKLALKTRRRNPKTMVCHLI